ncbi:MAG: hypothetical protein FJY29_08910 [Betaproteobacteria bacterium]|nr:hypothetical protein [Betaproteobacteria bacterium]
MAKENPVKLALASLVALGALGFLGSTMYGIDPLAELKTSLSSFWSDDLPNADSGGGQFASEILDKNETQSQKIGKNAAMPPMETLDLSGGDNLDLLSEELMEDRLWEEGISRSGREGVRSGAAVLDALAEIEGWTPVESGYNATKLSVYMRHPKLWVRMGAFAFALKAGSLDEKQTKKAARLIALKSRENPSQVSRFLKRYERKDPELFKLLLNHLVNTKTPAEETLPLQIDEDAEDAS